MQPDLLRPRAGSPLLRFFALTAFFLLALTLAWSFVADYAARPAAFVTRVTMEMALPNWVRGTRLAPHSLEVETRLRVDPSTLRGGAAPPGAIAELVVDVDPAHYGYSLPLLLALLAAGRGRRYGRRALVGAVCLVPFHAFSLVMDLAKQLAITSGKSVTAQLGFAQWQLELIGFGYQLGTLVVPTLAPILIWFWLDKRFVAAVLVEGWLDRQSAARRMTDD